MRLDPRVSRHFSSVSRRGKVEETLATGQPQSISYAARVSVQMEPKLCLEPFSVKLEIGFDCLQEFIVEAERYKTWASSAILDYVILQHKILGNSKKLAVSQNKKKPGGSRMIIKQNRINE